MSEPRRWTVNICRTHGPVPVYWQADQRGPRCSHYLRTKRPCGLPAPLIDVIEAAPVEAELERLWEQNDGLYAAIQLAQNEQERLRKIEAAARRVLIGRYSGGLQPYEVHVSHIPKSAADALREALGEPSDA